MHTNIFFHEYYTVILFKCSFNFSVHSCQMVMLFICAAGSELCRDSSNSFWTTLSLDASS